MPIVLEREGKTASEAIISACEELGVARSEIDVLVLDEGSRGVFGIGGKEARVRITVKREEVSEKGLKAKRALEEILKFLVSAHAVNLRETSDKIKLEVKISDDKGLIIGRRGEMIKALEFIVGKIAARFCEDGREKRVSIDIDGYKQRKEESISRMVLETARKVRKFGKPITLDPMSAYERRVTYLTLKHEEGISFETRGTGEEKRITINPTRSNFNRGREYHHKEA